MKGFLGSKTGNAVVVAVTVVAILLGVWLVDGWTHAEAPAGSTTTPLEGVSPVDVTVDESIPAPEVGQRAADFTAVSSSGQAVSLAALRGQPVWLVFGATWCSNCRAEAPDLQLIQDEYGDRVRVIAVHVGEDSSTVADYASRAGLRFAQIPDTSGDIAATYRVMGVPAHFFIAADGNIAAIQVGVVTPAMARAQLDPLLG
ncbi:MAG: TlpA family protein disulfide reductase [Propionibacteriaceae bacterium]|jgi:thiol-disulfide isomerase/thioredoxin|nr:TlpA family protein disulfide reductase [Propionibacteriaceae bacterium]